MAPGRDADRVTGLLTRYGTRAEDVMDYLKAGEDRLLHSTHELSVRELEFMAQRTDRAPGGRPDPPHLAGLPRPRDR